MKRLLSTIALVLATVATLVATAIDSDTVIRRKIKELYPDAIISHIEHENGIIEVELMHQNRDKEVKLTNDAIWISTEYDIRNSELPENIKNLIKNTSKYDGYSIDEVKVIETPSRSIYEIELDKWFSDDITIQVTFDGKIL